MGEKVWKTAEIAEAMGVSRNTVSMWRSIGLIKGEWRGHGYVYPDEEVNKLCRISKMYRISNRYYAQLAMTLMKNTIT